MLTAIRDRVGGWVASAIFAFISIPFALWGIESYFKGSGPQVVATVNGTEIPVSLFNEQLQQQKRRLSQLFGGKIPKDKFSDAEIRNQVIEGMVRDQLLLQELDRYGYGVSDESLLHKIREIPQFQINGKFDRNRYTQLLASQRRSEAEFEAGLRQEIQVVEFTDGISKTSFSTPVENSIRDRLKNQKRKFSYLVYMPTPSQGLNQVTDEAVEKRYREAIQRYQTQERVKVEYVELAQKDLVDAISVDEQALRTLYDQGGDELVAQPERRIVRHILLKLPESPKADDMAKLKAHAEDLVKQLRSGADFAKLAGENSDDHLSAKAGGSLGEIKHGDMDAKIDASLFALKEGETGDPLFTGSAFEILHVDKILPAVRKSFEQAHDQLASEYKQRHAESRFAELSEKLLTTSYEQSDSLSSSADTVGTPVQTSGWITRNDSDGIGSIPQVRDAAFSNEVLVQKKNSDLIELSDGRVLVLRVAAHELPKPKALNDVKDEIRQELAVEKALEINRTQANDALVKLRSGATMDSVAKQQQIELHSAGLVTRDAANIPAKILLAAFDMPKPQAGKASDALTQLPDGGIAVLSLDAIDETNDGGKTQSTAAKPVDAASDYGKREFDSVGNAIRAQAKIKIEAEEQ